MTPTPSQRNRLIFVAAVLLALLLAFLYWLLNYNCACWFHRKIHYEGFGIAIPAGYPIHGIDVSRHQCCIDWGAVSEMKIRSIQLDFCFIKATEGYTYVDPHFRRNWEQSGQTRLVRGAYHFFKPELDGLQQAEHFIRQVNLRPGDLPPVLDVEELGEATNEQLVREVRRWLERVETHYKVRPILYSGANFYNLHLLAQFAQYPLWVAHYNQSNEPKSTTTWKFWQHSDHGSVNGIPTGVDFNVFNGSRPAFDSLRIPTTIP